MKKNNSIKNWKILYICFSLNIKLKILDLRNKYKHKEKITHKNNPTPENISSLTLNQLKRQFSRRKDSSLNNTQNVSVNKSLNKSINKLNHNSFDYAKKLNPLTSQTSKRSEIKQTSFLSKNGSRGKYF